MVYPEPGRQPLRALSIAQAEGRITFSLLAGVDHVGGSLDAPTLSVRLPHAVDASTIAATLRELADALGAPASAFPSSPRGTP